MAMSIRRQTAREGLGDGCLAEWAYPVSPEVVAGKWRQMFEEHARLA